MKGMTAATMKPLMLMIQDSLTGHQIPGDTICSDVQHRQWVTKAGEQPEFMSVLPGLELGAHFILPASLCNMAVRIAHAFAGARQSQ